MALYLIAIPIGNKNDVGLRALEILRSVSTIILEERKEGTQFLRSHEISGKTYEQLNEHSTKEDILRLSELCSSQDIALITDAGTPGFCDPGAHLVAACRNKNISVYTVPGASSLMGLLSLSSKRINQFLFRGFLPAENVARQAEWVKLKKEKIDIVVMDTPYRLQKTLSEVEETFPERKILLTLNLTQSDEQILEGRPKEIKTQLKHTKAEFMMLIYAND